ncbi:MAG: ribosomal L7Ae/L30e/S12e/Gadd45 family protein [Eubacterium sp.]|nr:ribosomal L7Ae/L30e/S12e/Gadd45 family protein [Eubacterium sp.]
MNKIFSMVGLATRAGKTVAGEFSVEKAVKQRKAKLVIVSTEASDNTKKLFRNKCEYYQVPYVEYGEKKELGSATGNKERTSIAILDSEFGKSIIQLVNSSK